MDERGCRAGEPYSAVASPLGLSSRLWWGDVFLFLREFRDGFSFCIHPDALRPPEVELAKIMGLCIGQGIISLFPILETVYASAHYRIFSPISSAAQALAGHVQASPTVSRLLDGECCSGAGYQTSFRNRFSVKSAQSALQELHIFVSVFSTRAPGT